MVAATSSRSSSVDRDTVDRFRGGEGEAFLVIHDAHAPTVRALVSRFFTHAFEREEATQEVWLLVHRMAAAYDPARGEMLPWLRALAVNRCKELLRARGRRPDPTQELADEDLPDADDPEASARLGRLRAALASFSAGLSAEEAAVLRLSLLEERTHEEVAAATGVSVRRCKYLRAKLLDSAAAHPELRSALEEVLES